MPDHPVPAYPLNDVIAKARAGFVWFRRDALDGAAILNLGRQDIVDCIVALNEADFWKSMDAVNPHWFGCRQDVYKTRYLGVEVYVKFQYWPQSAARLYVVSFKEK